MRPATRTVPLASSGGRWLLAVTVAASGIAFLDSTAVTVALPGIGEDLGADVAGLQWVIDGYLVTMAALILLGGALGDHHGRRRVFLTGVVTFTVASVACALAPTVEVLVGARLVQGAGGALLTPSSLALLEAGVEPSDRGRAIGAWTGLTGVAAAAGPMLGGWLTDAVSWRLVFLVNLPLAALVLMAAQRHVTESRDPESARAPDVPGSLLLVGALGALAWGLIESGGGNATRPAVLGALGAGALLLVGFVVTERRRAESLVPLEVFHEPQFVAANGVTVFAYAALGSVFFLLVLHLQGVLGYSAFEAGAASIPVTALMLVLSPASGDLAQRIGPRLQMTVGPAIMAVAALLLGGIEPGDAYVTGVMPGVTLFGLGLAATVAPLTTTALGSVADRHAGVASGVNTAAARTAQLAAVAAVPVAAGISGEALDDPATFAAGFSTAMDITAVLAAAAAVCAFATIRNPLADR